MTKMVDLGEELNEDGKFEQKYEWQRGMTVGLVRMSFREVEPPLEGSDEQPYLRKRSVISFIT